MSELPWIKINGLDSLPKKPGLASYEHVECLIWLKHGAERVMWNCEHGVWDGEDGDDFFCGPLEPTHYLIITAPPTS